MTTSTRRTRLAAAAALGALFLGACGQAPLGVAAQVNGVDIPDSAIRSFVTDQVALLTGQGVAREEQLPELVSTQRQAVQELIRQELIAQEAARRGIVVTADDVEEMWQTQIAIAGSLEDLLARLDELGLDEADARDRLEAIRREELLADSVREEIEVSDDDVQALYDSQVGQWTTRTSAHIMVASQDEADEIRAALDQDPDQFSDLAAERSLDTNTGPLGGSLGATAFGTFPPEFDELLWSTPVGEIAGPVQTSFGWHVILVEDETTRTVDDVREQLTEQLRGQLFDQKFGELRQQLWVSAEIDLDGRYGAWDPETGEVVAEDTLES